MIILLKYINNFIQKPKKIHYLYFVTVLNEGWRLLNINVLLGSIYNFFSVHLSLSAYKKKKIRFDENLNWYKNVCLQCIFSSLFNSKAFPYLLSLNFFFFFTLYVLLIASSLTSWSSVFKGGTAVKKCFHSKTLIYKKIA